MTRPVQRSAFLDLPYIQEAQAQKHVTHNEAVRALDELVHLGVAGLADAPPAAPEDGARWLVGAAPSGAWDGHAHAVALWRADGGGAWILRAPGLGWTAWDAGAGRLRVWDGAAWAPATAPERVDRLGVGTEADATNRLAVAAPATLLTHAGVGGGDHRVTVNKAGAADTASLVFQSGWSGRAEMGLAGGDGFAVKVSADGATWAEALRVEPGSGVVHLPATPHFRVGAAAGWHEVTAPDMALALTAVAADPGGHVDAAGGFVAPADGLYGFGLSAVLDAGCDARVAIAVDGVPAEVVAVTGAVPLSLTAMLPLAAGQRVDARTGDAAVLLRHERASFWGWKAA